MVKAINIASNGKVSNAAMSILRNGRYSFWILWILYPCAHTPAHLAEMLCDQIILVVVLLVCVNNGLVPSSFWLLNRTIAVLWAINLRTEQSTFVKNYATFLFITNSLMRLDITAVEIPPQLSQLYNYWSWECEKSNDFLILAHSN